MRLTEALTEALKKHIPEETIILMSSIGEGRRILKEMSKAGDVLAGIRTATPALLAHEICAEYLSSETAPRLLKAAEAQDLMFRTLLSMPDEGFFSREHVKDRKTAELMLGMISELEENDAPPVGGNERMEALQLVRTAYAEAKGSKLLDPWDLKELAIKSACAFFSWKRPRFIAADSCIFSSRDTRLIREAAGESLSVIPVGTPDSVSRPRSCMSPESFSAPVDTDKIRFVRCRGVETEIHFIMRDILNRGLRAEDCAVICMSPEYSAGLCTEAAHYHIPVTISGGIPVTGSRVFFALNELNNWAVCEYDAEKLRSLVLSGAVGLEGSGRFVRRLRERNIGWGKDRYFTRFLRTDGEEKFPPDENTLDSWKDFLGTVLEIAEKQGNIDAQKEQLREFLSEYTAVSTAYEASAVARTKELLECVTWLDENETVLGRLLELMENASCLSGHEESGKLFAAPLSEGLCTGRKHLYICGMSRFCMQGSRQESPLLLDEEKTLYGLPTILDREAENTWRLHMILLHHDGESTLSYCDYDTERMIDLQPAPVYRELSRGREITRITYIPEAPLTLGDYECSGIKTTLRQDISRDPGEAVDAAALKELVEYEEQFSEMSFSPTSLEDALSCPLKFYLKRVIGLMPADLPERDSDVWLAANEMGSLCHAVLERFYAEKAPLEKVFQEELDKVKENRPPAGDSAVKNDTARAWGMVERAVRWTNDAGHKVLATEKPFGRKAGEDPLPLMIGGRTVRLSGSIDRMDELPDGRIAILDYKTGGSKNYRKNESIKLQPYLYALAAEAIDNSLKIDDSGYLFLRGSAEYFPVSQAEDARSLKEKVVCGLLDWMRDEDLALTAAPSFVISEEEGLKGTGSPDERKKAFNECSGWCEYSGFCTALKQIDAAELTELSGPDAGSDTEEGGEYDE